MPNRIILASFFIWILYRLVLAHERSHIMNTVHTHEDVNAVREKWGVDEIVRDLDHIREDISKVIKMEDAGLITTSEAIFYFFKMHDFDNNERLDGLEYLVAISHSMEHMIEIEDVTHGPYRLNAMNDCIKGAVPPQVYQQCCVQEKNCSITRQRDQGYECIARIILENITSSEEEQEDWRSPNSEYTTSSNEDRRNGLSHHILRAADYCQTLQREDQQRVCLRGEMMMMCQNSSGRYQPPRMGSSRSSYDDSRSSPRTFEVTRWMQTTRNPLNRFGQRDQRTDYYGSQNTGRGVYYPSASSTRPYNNQGTYGYQEYSRDGPSSFAYSSSGRVDPSSFDNRGSWNGDETSLGQISGYDSGDYDQRRS